MPEKGPYQLPFTIAFDSREKRPWLFEGLRGDAKQGNRPLIVPTVRATLGAGDYSIVGHETRVAVERKSIEDLFGTLTAGRDRFIRELERLDEFESPHVVCEASFAHIARNPPEHSRANPKSVIGSIVALSMRHRATWWQAESRAFAEWLTLRILWRWWIDNVEKPAQEDAA